MHFLFLKIDWDFLFVAFTHNIYIYIYIHIYIYTYISTPPSCQDPYFILVRVLKAVVQLNQVSDWRHTCQDSEHAVSASPELAPV